MKWALKDWTGKGIQVSRHKDQHEEMKVSSIILFKYTFMIAEKKLG